MDNIIAKSTTLQQIGGVAAGVASVYFYSPWIAAAYSSHITNLKGGSTGDIVKAGAIAGAAAYAGNAVGASGWGVYGQVAANVVIGTAAGVASGADFDSSFYASAFTAAASAGTANLTSNQIVGATIAATIGGTASEISGGKFVNGAVTGAFGYALGEAVASEEALTTNEGRSLEELTGRTTAELDAEYLFSSNEEYYAGVPILVGIGTAARALWVAARAYLSRGAITQGAGSLGANPFKGKTPQQIDGILRGKGFEPRGSDPVNGYGGYVNPKTSRSYHIDPRNRFGEPPHVDANRLRTYKGDLQKRKYF